jgi:hypothetical protein
MSVYGPADTFLLVGGKNLTGDTFTLDETVEEITEEVRPFGVSTDQNKGVGIGRIQLEAAGGLYDDRTAGMIAALQDHGGARQVIAYGMAGDSAGADAVMLDGALVTKWKRVVAVDGLTKAHAEYAVSSEYRRGRVLHGLTAETSDWDTEGDSVDQATAQRLRSVAITSSEADDERVLTAVPHGLITGDVVIISGHTSTPSINGQRTVTVVDSTHFTVGVDITVDGTGGSFVKVTSTGGYADLHVPALALGGHTGLVVSVLGSGDNVTFAPLVAFTARTTVGAERKSIAGQIPRYTAASGDFTGAGSPSAVPFVALTRNP